MKVIQKFYFLSYQEAQQVLEKKFNFKLSKNAVKEKAQNFEIFFQIGHHFFIPEELVFLLKESMKNKTRLEKALFRQSIAPSIEKFRKIINDESEEKK